MAYGVQMKREPALVDDYAAETQRSFTGDMATYRRQLIADRNNDSVDLCSQTSPPVAGRVPLTAFSQLGTAAVLV